MAGGLKKLWEHVKNLAAMLKAIHANALQRIMKGIRHSPRVIGAFPITSGKLRTIWERLLEKWPVHWLNIVFADNNQSEGEQVMENVAHETEKAISGAIKIDEKEIQNHIDGLVRQSV